MMRIMLDTMIYDKIIETPGMTEQLNQLSMEGKIEILSTHIQEDELAAIPDKQKRTAVQAIRRREVPTSGAIWNVSKWGKATWGDGSSGGIAIADIRSPCKGHSHDALIGTTAARDVDVLVTDDGRLANRMRASKSPCQVWGFARFKAFLSRQ